MGWAARASWVGYKGPQEVQKIQPVLVWNSQWGPRVSDPPKIRGKALKKAVKRAMQSVRRREAGRPA